MTFLKNIKVQVLLVFLVAILQYANTANHEYAWDDAIVLTENDRVKKGLSNIPELFENIKSDETANRYGYRPIALLSFATDVEFFGMDSKAGHKVSILYYGILCILILLFLNALFPDGGVRNLLITLLFVVHPLHTEVVANIKSRDEVLALIFGLSSLLLYQRALFSKPVLYFLLSAAFMVLAFLSKESAVTLCGVAFFMSWYLLKDEKLRTIAIKSVPAIVFVFVLMSIRGYVYSDDFFQSNDQDLFEKGLFLEDGFVGNPLVDASPADKLATAVYLTGYFAYRFVMPYPLLHDYSFNQFAVVSWNQAIVWEALLALLACLAATLYGLYKRKPFGFGLGFFLLTLTVYLHLVATAPDIFAERFIFVPSLGLCIALISVYEMRIKKQFVNATILVLLVPLFGYSLQRNKVWKDNKTLLTSDLPKLTNCVRANYNYALFLHRAYYQLPESKKPAKQKEILHYYEHTMELTDRLFNVYMDLGGAYMEFGQPEKALAVFKLAAKRYSHLSAPFVQLGKYHMSFKNYSEAIPHFKRAMKNGSKNSDHHYLLAICLFNSGWYDQAVESLLEGEKLGVSSPAYHSLIARLYVKLNMKQEAIDGLKRGLELYPKDQGLAADLKFLQEELSKED